MRPLDWHDRKEIHVAAHFGAEHLLMSGFTCRVRIGDRLQGEQSVRLLQIEDGNVYRSKELFTFVAPPLFCG